MASRDRTGSPRTGPNLVDRDGDRVAQCAGARRHDTQHVLVGADEKDVAGEASVGSGPPVRGEVDPGAVDAFLDLRATPAPPALPVRLIRSPAAARDSPRSRVIPGAAVVAVEGDGDPAPPVAFGAIAPRLARSPATPRPATAASTIDTTATTTKDGSRFTKPPYGQQRRCPPRSAVNVSNDTSHRPIPPGRACSQQRSAGDRAGSGLEHQRLPVAVGDHLR